MILEQLLTYLQSFSAGDIPYKEFSTMLFLLRDIIEETNVILDGTCAGV